MFERLHFKHYGYQYNLNMWTNNSGNIDQNTLSGQPKVPSSISRTSTTASNPTTIPATPMTPHLPMAQHIPTQHPGSHPPAPAIHVHTAPTSGLPTFPKNPSPRNSYPYYKKDPTLPSPQIPPHRSLHNSH